MIRLGIPQSALAFIFIGRGSRTPLRVGLYKNFQNKTKPNRITTGPTGQTGWPLNYQNWLSTSIFCDERHEAFTSLSCTAVHWQSRWGRPLILAVHCKLIPLRMSCAVPVQLWDNRERNRHGHTYEYINRSMTQTPTSITS